MSTIATAHGVRDEHVVVAITGGDHDHARLCFDNGLEHYDLRADSQLDGLLDARFGRPLPLIWADELNVHIEYALGTRMLRRASTSMLRLHAARAWSLDVHGGASGLDADLTGIDVRSVGFHAGAARVRLVLDRPTRPCRISFTSGHDVHIARPADVPVRLHVAGAATKTRLDDSWFGAVGGGLRDQTAGYEPDEPGYLVAVSGSVDTLTVVGRA